MTEEERLRAAIKETQLIIARTGIREPAALARMKKRLAEMEASREQQ